MKEEKIKDTCECQENKKEHDCGCDRHCECKDKHHKKHKEDRKTKELVEQLEKENTELKEKIKYHQAELINYRKRKDEETSNMLKYANQDLISEIILILDNFERAIKMDNNDLSDEVSKFLDGFKMMYVHLCDILKRFGVEEIDCLDKEFDPMTQEALMMGEDETKEDNTVLEVLLKGYKLKDRVIRPSAVRVNKLKEKEEMKNE